MKKAAILLCTSGREDILLQSIKSIVAENHHHLSIVIIDNNLKRLNESLLTTLQTQTNVSVYHEEMQGLSFARNRGIKLLKEDHILFLDDDVQLPENFFDKLIAIIESEQFDCFGGMYYPWYPQGKPAWLPADFGKKTPLLAYMGPIDVHKHGFLSAGVMCVKREAIEAVGGFRTDLGMTNSIGYGEEDDLQLRLQAAGYQLGFVPGWWLHHAVLAHKHQVSWHLKSAYAHARDAQRIHQHHQLAASLLGMIKTLVGTVLKRLPIGLRKYFFKQDYYWQNLVLDVLRPVYVHAGRLVGVMSSR